jgi:hypothetical protein
MYLFTVTPCIKKYYVNKREIEIKNRPVFDLFSKLNSYDLSNCCVTFASHCTGSGIVYAHARNREKFFTYLVKVHFIIFS